jgi:hypothetical protein
MVIGSRAAADCWQWADEIISVRSDLLFIFQSDLVPVRCTVVSRRTKYMK